MSDTNPLPAAQLRTAEDARYKRLQVALYAHRHEAFITCPESCWCWEVDAVLTEHEAARAASPVTLEEGMLAKWTLGEQDARPMLDHARRLAGEGGGQ